MGAEVTARAPAEAGPRESAERPSLGIPWSEVPVAEYGRYSGEICE